MEVIEEQKDVIVNINDSWITDQERNVQDLVVYQPER